MLEEGFAADQAICPMSGQLLVAGRRSFPYQAGLLARDVHGLAKDPSAAFPVSQ